MNPNYNIRLKQLDRVITELNKLRDMILQDLIESVDPEFMKSKEELEK